MRFLFGLLFSVNAHAYLGPIGAIRADGSNPFTGNVILNAQSDLRLTDADSSHYAALQAPATVAANYTLTLPLNDGDAAQVLQTDGAGALSWAAAQTGWTKNETGVIRNSGGNQTDASVSMKWQEFKRDGRYLIWSFDFRFNATFGSAGSPVYVKLPTMDGAQLQIDTAQQPGGDATTFLTSAVYGNAEWLNASTVPAVLYATYSLNGMGTGSPDKIEHIRFLNTGGGSLLDTSLVNTTTLKAHNLRIPIVGWQ